MPAQPGGPLGLSDFVDSLLDEARAVMRKLQGKYDELVRQNRKLADQLEDARDAIAERDMRIKELETQLANAGDHR